MPDNDRFNCSIDKVYQELDSRFGGNNPNQMFTMLFPTQPLNYRDFVYDTSDRTGSLRKPQVVAEAEFRLADQLLDPAPIVSGDNGKKLSTVYQQLLDSYVPDIKRLAPYLRDRAEFHAFLHKPISVGDKTTTRMDLFNQYFEEYTLAKRSWVTKLNDKKREALKDGNDFDLDDFATWVASMSPAEHAKIDATYSMIVTKGFLHETFAILGFLNSASPAETLERAKQSMRHSERAAQDETGAVYPVKFEPSNWFEAMKPNINPEDLTLAADAIISSLRARRQQLRAAQSQLASLQAIHVSEAQLKALEGEQMAARAALDDAERRLVVEHGTGTMNMVKSIMSMKKGAKDHGFDAMQGGKSDQDRLNSLLAVAGFGEMDTNEEAIRAAIAATEEVYEAQQENMRRIEDYEATRRRYELAKSNDFQLQIRQAKERILHNEAEIRELEELIISIHSARKGGSVNTEGWESLLKDGSHSQKVAAFKEVVIALFDGETEDEKWSAFQGEYPNGTDLGIDAEQQVVLSSIPEEMAELGAAADEQLQRLGLKIIDDKAPKNVLSGGLPRNNLSDEMDSMFTTITIVVDESETSKWQSESSSSSSSSWRVSSWFSSYSSTRHSSRASSYSSTRMREAKTTIAMRVMKVSFQRPWFQPSLLERTGDFHNVSDLNRAGLGANRRHIHQALGSRSGAPFAEELKDLVGLADDDKDKTYLLPSFPVAMLVAKDITIKMSSSKNMESDWNSSQSSSSSRSGGFLFFGGSSSNSSARSTSSSFSSASNKDVVIRIPGPQILGYINQLVPKDKSHDYQQVFDGADVSFEQVLAKYEQLFGTQGQSSSGE